MHTKIFNKIKKTQKKSSVLYFMLLFALMMAS
jgi:hypothetical protein